MSGHEKAFSRFELLCVMSAIVYANGDGYSPEGAVARADLVLCAAEHRYPADRPEEVPQLCLAANGNTDWYCSLPKGHIGEHVAFEDHDLNGDLLHKWPAVLAKGAGA